MVMSVMREKTKVVLFIALIAFVGLIFFDWGMQKGGGGGRAPGGVIGKVNGNDISVDSYRSTRQSIVAMFEARTGRSPEYTDYDAIEDEVWVTLVRDALVQAEIARHGVQTSDPEILEVLRTNPPELIRSSPDFLNEQGQFDPVRYSQALSDPSFNWVPAERYLRSLLPGDKLQNYVGLNAHVTTAEVRDLFQARNEKVRAKYVRTSAAGITLEEDAISESDLRAWYDANPDDFRAGERAILEVVAIPKTPTAEDSAATRDDLSDVREQILGGADFANTASTWSDDGSASRGGDLGFVRRGDMVPEFEAVAFETPVGEISEVFTTAFGYHILQVEELGREGSEETRKVRHILMRPEASNSTLRDAGRRIDEFLGALEEGLDFAEVAAEQGLEVLRTEPFGRDGVVPGLGLLRGASRFAFSREIGDVSTNPVEDETTIYCFRLAELVPPGPIPFEEVRDRIEALVGEEKRRERARAKLADALGSGGGTLEGIAEALESAVDTTGAFSREAFVPGVGRKNAFVAAAFALPVGQLSSLLETDRGFYVLEVVEKIPADETLLAEQSDELRGQLLMRKRQAMIGSWLEQLIREAEVVDYRGGAGVEWTPDPALFQYSSS